MQRDDRSGAPTALILRALGLGDFITGLPALRLLRQALPRHRLVLAAPSDFGELATSAGLVDDFLATTDLAPLRQHPQLPATIDIAVDLHGNGPASRRLLAECDPGALIAFTLDPQEFTGPRWNPYEHEVARWIRLVAEAFGVDAGLAGDVAGSLPVFDLPSRLSAGVVVVHPGASARARQWPPERYAAAAAALRREGHDVLVTGAASETSLVQSVAAAAGASWETRLSLPELLALVAHARLVLCGDTGIAHVASVYRTPSVVLFGPVAPAQWGPPPDPVHRALFKSRAAHGAGDPHGASVDPTLLALGVDEVLDACRQQVTLLSISSGRGGRR